MMSTPHASAISRRRFLGRTLALAGGLATTTTVGAGYAGQRPGRVRLTMPAPTGPHAIGTVALHLVDRARQDPWLTTRRPRELMVNLWYPARRTDGPAPAPWMSSGALGPYRSELTAFLDAPTGPDAPPPSAADAANISLDGVDFPITHAGQAAPAEHPVRTLPVVLHSPGFALDREHGTFIAEDLASHGYAVVTISHTYDAAEVEFPGGRVELGRHDLDALPNRAIAAIRAYVRAFFDQHLLGRPGSLLDAPSPEYPEVKFYPSA